MPVRDTRFINGVHVANPDIDQMIQNRIVKQHIIGTAVKLVLMESHKTPMVNQVIHGQPLLEDVPEVLLRILRPEQGRVDEL